MCLFQWPALFCRKTICVSAGGQPKVLTLNRPSGERGSPPKLPRCALGTGICHSKAATEALFRWIVRLFLATFAKRPASSGEPEGPRGLRSNAPKGEGPPPPQTKATAGPVRSFASRSRPRPSVNLPLPFPPRLMARASGTRKGGNASPGGDLIGSALGGTAQSELAAASKVCILAAAALRAATTGGRILGRFRILPGRRFASCDRVPRGSTPQGASRYAAHLPSEAGPHHVVEARVQPWTPPGFSRVRVHLAS